MTKKIVHINRHIIAANKRNGVNNPPLTLKAGRLNVKAHEVIIEGPSILTYSPKRPLKCGATAWIETEARVVAYDFSKPDGQLVVAICEE